MINKKRNLLGEVLIRYRFENRLNQENMAKKIGIHFKAYSQYETGKRIPNMDLLKKLAEICKFDIVSILEDSYKKNIKSFCAHSLKDIEAEKIAFDDLITIYGIIQKYIEHKKIRRQK